MEEPTNVLALEHQVADLMKEVEKYRAAAEEALGQLDWCIGYFTAQRQHAIARSLNANRSYVRSHLMGRAEQPLPTASPAPDSPKSTPESGDRIPRQTGGE